MREALWRKISNKIQYKVINREETKVDAWGKLINPPLKYSWRDIECAIELTVIEMKKNALSEDGGK